MDKDDTLVPVYEYNVKDKKIADTINFFKNQGVHLSIVSNSVIVD